MKLKILIVTGALSMLFNSAFAQQCVQAPDGVAGWWPGDGDATELVEGNDGTANGGVGYAPGIVDGAFQLDGHSGYVEVAHSPSLNIQNAITVDAWIMKLGDCTNNCVVVAKQEGTGPCCDDLRYALTVYGWGDNKVTFSLNTSYWRDMVVSNTPIVDGAWYHLAGTYDGEVARIYVNGMLDNEEPWGGPIKPSTGGPLFIGLGRHSYDEFFNGLVDEVEIFDRALSEQEILALHDAGSAGKCKAMTLSCAGFESPMANYPVSVKKNRALPLKAQIFDLDGYMMSGASLTAAPVLQVMYDSGLGADPMDVTEEALSAGLGTDGNQFVYTEDGIWQFNLKTKNYSAPGTYMVQIESGDHDEYVLDPACMTEFIIQ